MATHPHTPLWSRRTPPVRRRTAPPTRTMAVGCICSEGCVCVGPAPGPGSIGWEGTREVCRGAVRAVPPEKPGSPHG
eukprot:scaffold2844_cov326-Pavlova_lutheri.AAC.27